MADGGKERVYLEKTVVREARSVSREPERSPLADDEPRIKKAGPPRAAKWLRAWFHVWFQREYIGLES